MRIFGYAPPWVHPDPLGVRLEMYPTKPGRPSLAIPQDCILRRVAWRSFTRQTVEARWDIRVGNRQIQGWVIGLTGSDSLPVPFDCRVGEAMYMQIMPLNAGQGDAIYFTLDFEPPKDSLS